MPRRSSIDVARRDVDAVDEDPAAGRLDEPVDHLEAGRLAAAGRPDEDADLAGGTVSDRSLTAPGVSLAPRVVALGDVVELDGRGGRAHRGGPIVIDPAVSLSRASTSGLTSPMKRSKRLDVVRRRLLGDDRPETELDVRQEPLRDLLRRAVPERVVVLEVGERRPVVLHRGLPDAVRLGLRVADGDLDAERELDLADVAPDGVAVALEDLDLVGHDVERAHRVPHVRVLGHRPQRLLLAASRRS